MLLNNRNLFTSGCKKTGTPGVLDCQENSRKNTEIFFTVCILMRLYKNGNAKLLNNKVVNNGNL